jgi:hypothetical protein
MEVIYRGRTCLIVYEILWLTSNMTSKIVSSDAKPSLLNYALLTLWKFHSLNEGEPPVLRSRLRSHIVAQGVHPAPSAAGSDHNLWGCVNSGRCVMDVVDDAINLAETRAEAGTADLCHGAARSDSAAVRLPR